MAAILPYLYLGNLKSRFNTDFLDQHGIKCVVNAASQAIVKKYATDDGHIRHPSVAAYYDLGLRDKGDKQSADMLLEAYDGVNRLILSHLEQKQPVLVHCYAGKHRSPALVIAFLMWRGGVTYLEAVAHVQKACPNISKFYHPSLKAYEARLKQRSSEQQGR